MNEWKSLDELRDYVRSHSHYDPKQLLNTINSKAGVHDWESHPDKASKAESAPAAAKVEPKAKKSLFTRKPSEDED